jgi:hypothetical protein
MRVLNYLRGWLKASIGWAEKEEPGQTLLLPREAALKLARKQIQRKTRR